MRPAAVATVVAGFAALGAIAPSPADASPAIFIRIAAPADGSTVSGSVLVEAETTGTVTVVEFEWSADGGAAWQPIGIDGSGPDRWSVVWETSAHSGPAIVRATATGGAERASDSAAVIVDNVAPVVDVRVRPSPFSPNGDGRLDVATIEVDAGEPAEVSLRILDSAGAVVRRWAPVADRAHVWEWGGGGSGGRVPDGRYVAEATARDGGGFTTTASAPIAVDTTPPRVRWIRPVPSLVRAPRAVTVALRVRDRSPTGPLVLSLSDAVGEVWRTEVVDSTGTSRSRWTARYPNGEPLFPGPYRVSADVRDEAGNLGTSETVFRVERSTPARVFRRVEGAGPRVALTFDDCHYAAAWARILDVLEARRVGATFFCPGTVLSANAALARRSIAEGHTAGAHGWDHADLAGRAVSETERRLRADARSWWTAAGTTGAPYFRPPYGSYDRAVLSAAASTSHPRVVMWDVDTRDWQRPGSGAITTRAVSEARPGSIILLHTLPETAAALPAIIDGLRRKGLEPVTLPVLFRAGGYR